MNRPQQNNRIFLILLAASLLILLVGVTSESLPLLGIGSIFAFSSFVFTFRCPHCRHYLGRQSGTDCPHCKKKIN